MSRKILCTNLYHFRLPKRELFEFEGLISKNIYLCIGQWDKYIKGLVCLVANSEDQRSFPVFSMSLVVFCKYQWERNLKFKILQRDTHSFISFKPEYVSLK